MTGDTDGDHRADLVCAYQAAVPPDPDANATYKVGILRGSDNGLELEAWVFDTPLQKLSPFTVGDLDNNGTADIILIDARYNKANPHPSHGLHGRRCRPCPWPGGARSGPADRG